MTTKSKTKWTFALALALALTVVVLGLLTLTPMRAQAAPLVDVPARPLGDYVSGVITQSTTWTLDHSPYTLTADVTVATGVTLTIEPGVVVMGLFNDNYNYPSMTIRNTH